MSTAPKIAPPHPAPADPSWLRVVRDRVTDLRFGTVQIVVHDGRVTQIDTTQRTRFSSAENTL